MSKTVKTEKALITPEQIAKENKALLKPLAAIEAKAVEIAKAGNLLKKDLCKLCAEIERDNLYKARGYSSVNKYLADGHLAGLSSGSVSQYLETGRFLLEAEKDANKAKLAEKLTAEQIYAIHSADEKQIEALANNENTASTPAKELNANIKSGNASNPKVLKKYDISVCSVRVEDGAAVSASFIKDTTIEDFQTRAGILIASVHKVAKLENGLKDSFAWTAVSADLSSMYFYTTAPHITKATDHYESTPEAREESTIAFLESLDKDALAALLAKLDK